jgi:hypothetical protein
MIIEDLAMTTKLDRLAAVLAGGILFLRAISLVRRPLWFDEIFTLWIARQSPRRIVDHLRFDSGPPLFYFLAAPFVRIGELLQSDALARLLSFAAIGLLFAAVRPRYGSGSRFTLLLAASPLLFFYSAEARPYALLSAVSFLLFLAGFRARDTPHSRLTAAIAAAALPWIHYLGIFVVAGSLILCLIRKRWAGGSLQLAGASVFLIWAPIASHQRLPSLAWNQSTASSSFLRAPEAFGFWGEIPPYFSDWRTPAHWAGAVIGFALVAAAAAEARKSRAIRDALVFSLVPLSLAMLASVVSPIYFPGRTEMATLPVALWGFARASRRSSAVNALTLAAVLAGTIVIAESFPHPAGPYPYSETAKFLGTRARSADLVVGAEANYLPLRLSQDRGDLAAPLLGLPSAIELHPGWFETGTPPQDEAEIDRLRKAVSGVRPGGKIYLAIPPDPALRDLAERSFAGEPRRVLRPPQGYAVLEIGP